MATSTILQNHSSAMTVFTLPGGATNEITLSGGGSRGVILVGVSSESYAPSLIGFRFTNAGTSWSSSETISGSSFVTRARSGTNKFTLANAGTQSVTIVIFMSEQSVSSIANVTPS